MTEILITGGAGFVGTRLAAALLKAGYGVTVFDSFHPQIHSRPEEAARVLSSLGAVLEIGDIRDSERLSRAIARAQPTAIVHLAAETGTGQSFDLPVRYCETNVTGTARLIEAIRSEGSTVRRVLLAGSRAVYGEGACVDDAGCPTVAESRNPANMRRGDFLPRDRDGRSLNPVQTDSDCPPAPVSIYASTKLMQEYLLRQAFYETGTQVGILRLQNVYGPGQSLNNPYTGVLSIFIQQLLEGRKLNIYEDGLITRDFVYVDDVVEAFLRILQVQECPDRPVDIGTGIPATILDVADLMIRLLRLEPEMRGVSGDFRPGDIRYAVADPSFAKSSLGWVAQTPIEDGISALIEWARADASCG